MTDTEKILCEDWLKAHSASWQVLNRAQWKYVFHPKTLVRYIEDSSMREDEVKLILEYLSSDDCISQLNLYDQKVEGYKPIKAWFEASNRAQGNIRALRLYHALQTDLSEADDGPYVVEEGCAWKVSHTYVWQSSAVPEAQKSTSGVMYRIQSLNRDPETGLYSYVIEKRERVQQDIPEYVREVNAFATVKEELHLGVKAEDIETTGKIASSGNGVLVERKVTKNEDCTSDIQNVTVTEETVENAIVTKSKKLHAVITSVTHRNEATALTDDTSELKVGESRKSQMTPGGLYDNTHEQVDQEEVGEIGTDCEKTIFAHESRNTKNQNYKPEQCTRDAGEGHIYSKSARQTEYGTWDVTETDRKELAVSGAVKSYRKTLHGVIETTEDRGQQSPLEGSGLKVGESRESKMTPGGLYDNTKVSAATEAAGEVAKVWTEDRFSQEETISENKLEMEDPSKHLNEDGVLVEVIFEQGKIVRKSSALNNDGTADVDTRTVKAKPAMHTYQWSDAKGNHTRIWYRNQNNTQKELVDKKASSSEMHETINEFGLFDGTIHYADIVGGGSGSGGTGDTTGEDIYAWEERYVGSKNIRYVRRYTLQVEIKRGIDINSYDNSVVNSNLSRTTPGILLVRSLERAYEDNGGVRKKDWAEIRLKEIEPWEKFSKEKHKNLNSSWNIASVVKTLLANMSL